MFERCGAVPLVMEPGDVLFHCVSTPHGSTYNHSGMQRRIFYVHFLNEEVYRDAYAAVAWAASKPGWGEWRRGLVLNMLKKRAELGLAPTDLSGPLQWTEDGFVFRGTPASPPRYWEELQAQLSPAEIAELKTVRPVTA